MALPAERLSFYQPPPKALLRPIRLKLRTIFTASRAPVHFIPKGLTPPGLEQGFVERQMRLDELCKRLALPGKFPRAGRDYSGIIMDMQIELSGSSEGWGDKQSWRVWR